MGMGKLIREQYEWSNNWWNNANDETLPRVLLVGDSISCGYGPKVIERFAGVVNVDRLANSRGPSDPTMLKELQMVIEDRPHVVIHFNNGLHSLHLSASEYEAGMRDYVATIRKAAPTTPLIWALSTPVTVGGKPSELEPKTNAIVLERNDVVRRLATEFGIETNDLYRVVVGHAEYCTGDGYHYNDVGNVALGEVVTAAIRRKL
jgi:lysophospholipase L1-like esterase